MKLQKHQKKTVSNEEYNIAYNNKDNQRIIKAVLFTYRGKLDEDTLKTCGLNALWRCLQNHNESFSTKFTSSLWRFVNWECKKELRTLATSKYKPLELFDVANEEEEMYSVFDDLHDVLDQEYCQIIKLRFLEKMTLREIGNKFGYTKEAARQKLEKAIGQIRMVYNSKGKDKNGQLELLTN